LTVLGAYGGVERWRELETIKIHQIVGGVLWTLKNVDGVINDSTVEIRVQEQRAWHRPFTRAGLRSSYSPGRVAIETDDDSAATIDALISPRDSFTGHELTTPWTMLQLVYFAGYAMWTYLSEPYSLTFPGVTTEELGPWDENGQVWRRLGVRYPGQYRYPQCRPELYVDSDGFLQRRDYQVDIAGGSPAAHYIDDHREFEGIIVPLRRIVHVRDEDRHPVEEPVTVSIDIDEVTVG
jgi:hypothetical protein